METEKPWYRKKRYLALLVATVLMWSSGSDNPTAQDKQASLITSPPVAIEQELKPVEIPTSSESEGTIATPKKVIETKISIPKTEAKKQPESTPRKKATSVVPTPNSGLSNDNYYTNSKGSTVHSPAYSNTIPAGASARCRDGTYSFSQSRRGTCSHHGGVAEWL